jgi:hypothetical protein
VDSGCGAVEVHGPSAKVGLPLAHCASALGIDIDIGPF